ncbi:MAG: HEAT repeat domain-containing protein [Gemmataceae bacterium]|nr:HEAT repeat domain-containing protein [Gemmataceae bacterium]
MTPRIARFYHPNAADRVAAVSVQPAPGRADRFTIQTARGSRATHLPKVVTTGPFSESELPARFAEAEQALRSSGYFPAGVHALLEALESPEPQVRARAAARLGWLRSPDAVEPLLARVPIAVDDVCAILDALGAIGDARAVPILRQQAARKLLSRRRSAVEALRNLGEAEGLSDARTAALERLPETVRPLVASEVDALIETVLALTPQNLGLAIDTLYELATPLTVAATRAVLRKVAVDRPHMWRYVKSVHKRSMLRHDYAMFGELSHAIEVQARSSKGTTATVKSGYDGAQRKTRIFGPNTQRFVRRSTWRYLRMLAKHRPDAYALAAAEAIVAYKPDDEQEPKGLYGAFASCYLLHRIVWGKSSRFHLDDRRLKFRFRDAKHIKAPADTREEAFPELWDRHPHAFLRVLGGSTLLEVQTFAVHSFLKTGKHQETLAAAPVEAILALLQAPYEPTVALGLEEIDRRFDPEQPDWMLLRRLLSDERPVARQLGQRFVRRCAGLWTCDPERIIEFLAAPHGEIRALIVELAALVLTRDAALRETLAPRILAILRTPEPSEGAHDGYARLAQETLRAELNALLTVAELAEMVFRGSPAAQSVAAELLSHRPEAIAELGLERITSMAQHAMATVRSAALGLLRSTESLLRADPAPLFVLVESEWADTRGLAFDMLRRIDFQMLGFDGLLGLLDSNRVDVQNVGRELALAHFPELQGDELTRRVTQHPHPNMRRFALDLVEKHLPAGAEALEPLARFCRTVLFDLWPDRALKRRVIDFLLKRGLEDEAQAEIAASLLGDFVRIEGRGDFERALEALVRLKLAHPGIEAGINLQPGGVA